MAREHLYVANEAKDNVGIVTGMNGLEKGTVLSNGIVLTRYVPAGQKVALRRIGEGENIIRYGETIGFARNSLERGDWLEDTNLSIPPPADIRSIPLPVAREVPSEPLEGYTFQGYRNSDGSVGTKNILGVASTVQCAAGVVDRVVASIKKKLLPHYPGVDDVVALNHNYGCGVAIDAPSAVIPIRTIRNILTHPNFGGEVLLIGLGCEKLQMESCSLMLQDESLHGFEEMVRAVMDQAERKLKKLNQRKRETCPASDLVVGIQCGGSDVFSGITANPVAGFTADLIVRAGGSVLFSEVTEVRDALHVLVPRAINPEVGQKLLDEVQWFDDYLRQGNADRSANPSPGNRAGGLSSIVEKALGSIVKSGTSPIMDVLGPGEKVRCKGLTFAATPASDFVCGTLQLAAGMNLHLFTTGRGSPYGLAMVPVVKLASNDSLAERWADLIDLNAGQVIGGKKSIQEMGWELFHLILEVASGKRQVASERLGLYNDLVLFNPGPLT